MQGEPPETFPAAKSLKGPFAALLADHHGHDRGRVHADAPAAPLNREAPTKA
jgi:hypothetical protein